MRNEVERAITFKISDRIIIHKRVLVTGIIIFVELQLLGAEGLRFGEEGPGEIGSDRDPLERGGRTPRFSRVDEGQTVHLQ